MFYSFCRFVKELSWTSHSSELFSAEDPLEYDKTLLVSLLCGISGVTYSAAVAKAVLGPSSSSSSTNQPSVSRFDDLRYLPKIVDGLALMLVATDYLQPIHTALMLTLSGLSGGSVPESESAGGWLWVSAVKKVLCGPILSLPLLDYFVLCVTVTKAQQFLKNKLLPVSGNAENPHSYEYILSCLKWVAVARLVQLIHSKSDSSRSVDATNGLDEASSIFGVLFDHVCHGLEGVLEGGAADVGFKRQCSRDWKYFLSRLINITIRLCPELATSLEAGSDDIDALIHALGLISLVNLDTADESSKVLRSWIESQREVVSAGPVDSGPVEDEVELKIGAEEQFEPNPNSSQNSSANANNNVTRSSMGRSALHWFDLPTTSRLLELPEDYSKLHSHVTSLCSYDAPCLCLVCGAVLDGGGKGQCTAHTSHCGGEVGIFFQLQVIGICIIILLCY